MQEKNNTITELVFILDRSGSMIGLEQDTIGGFNSLIEKQKADKGQCYVTTVLFDGDYELLHDRVSLDKVNKLTDKDYYVRGSTALIDAMGKAIDHISDVHKYIREEDVPQKTLFVITTDGMENASHIYTSDKVKKMVEAKKKQGWEFLFIGANIDAVETAKCYGIDEDCSVNYHADKEGTHVLYESVGSAISEMRCAPAMPMSKEWKSEIEKDYKKRK